ncbi:OmpA family protein [Chondromyces apiculatus]|uniref:Outer membrane lipoprotein omp16 n=1 Tax=Chondromyces apiculatus DSM 436 TaxID=1192034 RepID=A0A017THJ7_9BACT|nr:OmpA family protein [Chondromyces apiculatus]EYF08758.1 Outer membrane lipoprotein omp16 precursor [Chondromyces apiculatus DSM 436]
MKWSRSALVLGLGFCLGGCAAAQPPQELVNARAAYERAQASKAPQLTPVPLHDAKQALNAAEGAFNEDAESQRTRDLAYIAERKALLAESKGNTAQATTQRDQAHRELAQLQSQMQTRQLANAQAGMQAAQANLAATQGALNKTQAELASEKKAREEAERRARDAMDKLAVASALAVKEEQRGTVITIPSGVLFTSGKYALLPAAQQKLDQVADALKNQDDRKIIVEGHTDSQGTDESNMVLGKNRAQSVRDYLVSRGVPAEMISATGLGESRPVADNNSAEGRANNRRVEIIVQPVEKR